MGDNDTDRTVSKPDWWDEEPAWMKSARESTSGGGNNSRNDDRDRDDRDRDRDSGRREYARSRGSDNGELLDAINALPERLTSGLREALTGSGKESKKSAKTDDSGDKETKSEASSGTSSDKKEQPGGRKSFADRWFN